MKITIETIKNKIAAANAAREQAKENKLKAASEAEELKLQADAAAEAGNLELFMTLKRKLDDANTKAGFYERQLAMNDKTVTPEEIAAAWASYASDYSKKLSAANAEYQAAKSKALDAFQTMLNLQHEALVQRDALARIADLPLNNPWTVTPEVETTLPMQYVSTLTDGSGISFTCGTVRNLDADLAFYISSLGLMTEMSVAHNEEVMGIIREHRNHRPH